VRTDREEINCTLFRDGSLDLGVCVERTNVLIVASLACCYIFEFLLGASKGNNSLQERPRQSLIFKN